jgi:hypothetical protein
MSARDQLDHKAFAVRNTLEVWTSAFAYIDHDWPDADRLSEPAILRDAIGGVVDLFAYCHDRDRLVTITLPSWAIRLLPPWITNGDRGDGEA